MTVNAISNTALLDPSQNVDTSWQTRMQQALGPVAQLFGESAQQLEGDLQSGKTSLSALAQSKGVSQTDLVNAIKQGLQQSSANGGPQLSDSQLTNIANGVANRVHGGHHHHHAGGVSPFDPASGTASGTSASGVGSADPSSGSSATGSSAGSPTLQLDVERLMFDLQNMQSSAANGASTTASSAASTSTYSSASTSNLLNQLTQFDQTL